MTTKVYQLETLTCPSCIFKIKGMLKRTDGVSKSKVSLMSSKVRVTFDEEKVKSEDIKKSIDNLGFQVLGEV